MSLNALNTCTCGSPSWRIVTSLLYSRRTTPSLGISSPLPRQFFTTPARGRSITLRVSCICLAAPVCPHSWRASPTSTRSGLLMVVLDCPYPTYLRKGTSMLRRRGLSLTRATEPIPSRSRAYSRSCESTRRMPSTRACIVRNDPPQAQCIFQSGTVMFVRLSCRAQPKPIARDCEICFPVFGYRTYCSYVHVYRLMTLLKNLQHATAASKRDLVVV